MTQNKNTIEVDKNKFVDRQPFMDNTKNEKLLNELLERKKLEEK